MNNQNKLLADFTKSYTGVKRYKPRRKSHIAAVAGFFYEITIGPFVHFLRISQK